VLESVGFHELSVTISSLRTSEPVTPSPARHARPGPTALDCHCRQWRPGKRVRRVQGLLGLSWQITPRALTDALAAGGAEAKRVFEATM
jgi:hypothetical protein